MDHAAVLAHSAYRSNQLHTPSGEARRALVLGDGAEWTVANHLRHARFVGIRDDVEPREVVGERAA